MQLILASKSPRRREILQLLGVPFEAVTRDTDETLPRGILPQDAVMQLSARKAKAVADGLNETDAVIIGADTVVFCRGEILGKPCDKDDAQRMLTMLSGTTHEVFTGLTLCGGGQCLTQYARTAVTFRTLAPAEIDAYMRTGECCDKAGAYAVQGLGSLFVDRIDGDFYNVIGLPVFLLRQMLAAGFGLNLLELAAREKESEPNGKKHWH